MGEVGKPGLPLVPGYLDLPVASDREGTVQHSYGLDEPVGYAFIGSDGRLQAVHNRPLSPAELRQAMARLR